MYLVIIQKITYYLVIIIIDLIYFCMLTPGQGVSVELNPGWIWVTKEHLAKGLPLKNDKGDYDPPPEDVLILASHAFEAVNLIT